jgi:Lipid A 3-O-deacylase (PagL)
MHYRVIFLILFILGPFLILAQREDKNWSFQVPNIELSSHLGKLIKIHGEYPENKTSSVLELFFSWSPNLREDWVKQRGNPRLGLSLTHLGFGNKEVLGTAVGLIPMVEYVDAGSPFYLRLGLGVGRFSRPYDPLYRPDNLVFGSRFANVSMISMGFRLPLADFIDFRLGCSYIHASNAHVRVPNIGGNIVALNAAFVLGGTPHIVPVPRLNYEPYMGDNDTVPRVKKRKSWRPGFHLIQGYHSFPGTVRPANGPLYSVSGLSVYFIQKNTKNMKPWMTGLNYHYYRSYREYILSQELFPANEANLRAHHLTWFVGRDIYFGAFSFFFQTGINLYAPFLKEINRIWDLPKKGIIYTMTSSKIGYRYHAPLKGLFGGIAVKASGGTADFLEFELGYEF